MLLKFSHLLAAAYCSFMDENLHFSWPAIMRKYRRVRYFNQPNALFKEYAERMGALGEDRCYAFARFIEAHDTFELQIYTPKDIWCFMGVLGEKNTYRRVSNENASLEDKLALLEHKQPSLHLYPWPNTKSIPSKARIKGASQSSLVYLNSLEAKGSVSTTDLNLFKSYVAQHIFSSPYKDW